jgi:RimJ/RimL family protein N-acetyltransferase
MTVAAQTRVVLADGELAMVRRLHPGDAAEVLALHTRMNDTDRCFRFFGSGPAQLDDFAARLSADTGTGHVGVGCFLGAELIGVAQYEVLADPVDAEIAVVVDGAVRAHGVATLLLEHLVDLGRHGGVRKFIAEVLAANSKMIRVFASLGLPIQATGAGPERKFTLLLDPTLDYRDAVDHRDLVADTASLGHLFRPSSVAVIGAGRRAGSVGHAVLANLITSGYPGTRARTAHRTALRRRFRPAGRLRSRRGRHRPRRRPRRAAHAAHRHRRRPADGRTALINRTLVPESRPGGRP